MAAKRKREQHRASGFSPQKRRRRGGRRRKTYSTMGLTDFRPRENRPTWDHPRLAALSCLVRRRTPRSRVTPPPLLLGRKTNCFSVSVTRRMRADFPPKPLKFPQFFPTILRIPNLFVKFPKPKKSRVCDTRWPRNGCLWSQGTLEEC